MFVNGTAGSRQPWPCLIGNRGGQLPQRRQCRRAAVGDGSPLSPARHIRRQSVDSGDINMSRRMIAPRMPDCAMGTSMALATISFLLGAALAWRFNVFVLIPTTAISLAIIAAAGIAHGEG